MARLVPLNPCAGLLPRRIGAVTLTEVDPGPVTLIAPFRGRRDAVSAVLQGALGLGFPAPNTTAAAGPARILWIGPDKALLMGMAPPPDLESLAALVDQSDASAVIAVAGPRAGAALARLIPLDLRARAFAVGQTARTLVNHMTASLTRTGDQAFEIMVFRSMAITLVNELIEAAEGLAARP